MIYVIGERPVGVVKIGWAKQPPVRLKELQTGYPRPLRVLGTFREERAAEHALHQAFASRRLTGEWFDFAQEDSVAAVGATLGSQALVLGRTPSRPGAARRRAAKDLVLYEALREAAWPWPDGRVIATNHDMGQVLGVDASAVSQAIKRLRATGLVSVVRPGTGMYSTVYRVFPPQGSLDLQWEVDPTGVPTEMPCLFQWEEGTPWLIPERRVQAFPGRSQMPKAGPPNPIYKRSSSLPGGGGASASERRLP